MATPEDAERALDLHRRHQGKIEVKNKVRVQDAEDLSLAYTPGVAEPCKAIQEEPLSVYDYTAKGNMVAVVTDGSAVLGLGDIGPEASLPVMEGKAILFKRFAGVDGFPICLDADSIDEIATICRALQPTFGGINLEDISAPRCFEIERRLKDELKIPVFHDDQHGTAIIVLAGLINALDVVGKSIEDACVVINGAGSGGLATAKILRSVGAGEIRVLDSTGLIHPARDDINPYKAEVAKATDPDPEDADLAEAIDGADVFVGLSVADVLSQDMVESMADDPIVFALANPDPEIMPDDAHEAGAEVVATGRSDFPNQINNALGFPGIFRGALDVKATDINEEMKLAAAEALARIVDDDELAPDYIIPPIFDPRPAAFVAVAVAQAAVESGVARREVDRSMIMERLAWGNR